MGYNTDNVAIDQQQPLQVPNKQLMHDIQSFFSKLVSKAGRLIHNTTTNFAENCMQIRCKFDGGKVINRSQSGSFQFRCYGAGLQKNLGKTWGVSMWEKMTGDYPMKFLLMQLIFLQGESRRTGSEKPLKKLKRADEKVNITIMTTQLQLAEHILDMMVSLNQKTLKMTFYWTIWIN